MKNHKLIAIAGVVGVGKTTLASNLAAVMEAKLVLEDYAGNPYLPDQLAGDSEASLLAELHFLMSRAAQLDRSVLDEDSLVVADYLFHQNRLFAELSLSNEQFATYSKVEAAVERRIARPGVIVYLKDTLENCLGRIASRGRDFEQGISAQWLGQMAQAYDKFLNDWPFCPVVDIDCGQLDLRQIETAKRVSMELPDDLRDKIGCKYVP